MLIGELEVALDVGQKLDSLGVTWLVGGSVASSILGEPRATADVAPLPVRDPAALDEPQ